ncbi:MAG: glycosyltransferase family 2 protein [Acidobacteria bacterium]|nr:glycosyltransferase family 2 protein [Acidobacteriota bacterium]
MADVSFIIPSYKPGPVLEFCLQSIHRQQTALTYEILVVDSSPDGFPIALGQDSPTVQVFRSPERLSPGRARNWGAEHAKGKLIAFLDADAVASTDWLEKACSSLSGERRLVGGAVLNANPESLASRVLYLIEFSDYLPGLVSEGRAVLSSSNLLLSRNDFMRAGGFDERLEMAEDLLFCLQFPRQVFFNASAHIQHYHRTEWNKVKAHLRELGYWSGKLRRSYPLPGSWVRNIPMLSFLVPVYRSVLIAERIRKSSIAKKELWLQPLVVACLFYWAAGFYRGIQR